MVISGSMYYFYKVNINQYTLSFFLLLSVWLSVQAQNVNIRFFNGKTKRTKDELQQRMKEYQRIKKENQQYLKERKKHYKAMKDSLKNAEVNYPDMAEDSLKMMRKLQKQYFIYTDSLYDPEEMASWDSIKVAGKERALTEGEERLSGNAYFQRYKALEGRIGSYRRDIKQYRDSLKSIDSLDKQEVKLMVIKRRQELSKQYEKDLEGVTRDIVNSKAPDLPGGFENKELEKFKAANEHLMN